MGLLGHGYKCTSELLGYPYGLPKSAFVGWYCRVQLTTTPTKSGRARINVPPLFWGPGLQPPFLKAALEKVVPEQILVITAGHGMPCFADREADHHERTPV